MATAIGGIGLTGVPEHTHISHRNTSHSDRHIHSAAAGVKLNLLSFFAFHWRFHFFISPHHYFFFFLLPLALHYEWLLSTSLSFSSIGINHQLVVALINTNLNSHTQAASQAAVDPERHCSLNQSATYGRQAHTHTRQIVLRISVQSETVQKSRCSPK